MFDDEWLGDEHDTPDVLRAQSSERTFQFLAHPSLDDLSPQAQVANRYLGLLGYIRRDWVSEISHHTDAFHSRHNLNEPFNKLAGEIG
jgi:hypothetical protein